MKSLDFKFFALLLTGLFLLTLLAACGDSTTTPTTAPAPTATIPPVTTAPAATTAAPAATTAVTLATVTAVATTAAPLTTAVATTASPTTAAIATTVAPAATTAAVATTISSGGSSIRQTKWQDVFKADPALEVKTLPGASGPQATPYLTVKADNTVTGSAWVEGILYLDMDGDGVEEAVIPLGFGTIDTNFLVYKQATPAPKLVSWGGGFDIKLNNELGQLQVIEPIQTDWEGECCPSGWLYTNYNLKDGKLNQLSRKSVGRIERIPGTVEHFYALLNAREFEQAYKFLSPDYQKANPFRNWQAGYATTRKISAKAKSDPNAPNVAQIELSATDANNQTETTKGFTGSWKAIWSGDSKSWLLDSPSIKEAPAPTPDAATVLTKAKVINPFQASLQNLKRQVQGRIPVLFPTYLTPDEAALSKYFGNLEGADSSGYSYILGATPDCGGGTACRFGTFVAETPLQTPQPIRGTPNALANNLTGYFVPYTCGANCSDSTLTWQQGNVRYTIGLKTAKLEELIKAANSAITNGPVF